MGSYYIYGACNFMQKDKFVVCFTQNVNVWSRWNSLEQLSRFWLGRVVYCRITSLDMNISCRIVKAKGQAKFKKCWEELFIAELLLWT